MRTITYRTLPENKDWLMLPVLKGLCSYESLLDGKLSLDDIAEMNDALACQNDNEARTQQALQDYYDRRSPNRTRR